MENIKNFKFLYQFSLALCCLLLPVQTSAEVIWISPNVTYGFCGASIGLVDKNADLVLFDKDGNISAIADDFVEKVLTLMNSQALSVLDSTASPKRLRRLEASRYVKSLRNNCHSYLDANYRLIAVALAKNQAHQSSVGYIPINTVGYFMEIATRLYPGKERRPKLQNLIVTYLPQQPALRDYLLDQLA